MTTRSEREKAQKQNEQHQAILSKMLREEDNKYCADCEAKGPRWASWNLGVFICIRCAGIHRNLGVHISRVKSVNLDQWTPEQIQCMQDIGNTKARALYEGNLPENFRRPQTDQSVEFFIRDKYERKKYYDKNAATKENQKKKEEKKKEREAEKNVKPIIEKHLQSFTFIYTCFYLTDTPADGLVANGSSSNTAALNDDLDIFGPMISNPLPASTATPAQVTSTTPAATTIPSTAGDLDLFTDQTGKSEDTAKKPLSKDSILSLYGTANMQQQSTPGMFMGSSMPYSAQPTTSFQAFPSMGVPVPPMPGMGQNTGMMVGMGMPNGFVGNPPSGVMGVSPNMMGPQGMVGNMAALPNKFGMQQGQQSPWNLSQMNQQMSGINLNGASNMMAFGQPANSVGGGWAGNASGQTLSTQLWK
uniref:Small ArfGAP 1 n=1 Tax=Leptobrachium leishanense TaxID=445787 RepID=A0A8C5QWS6_9ANUR